MRAAADALDVADDVRRERGLLLGLLGVFVAIAAFAVGDLLADLSEATSWRHLILEGGIALSSLGGVVWMAVRVRGLLLRTRALRAEARALATSLASSRVEAERFRVEARDLIRGLSVAIDAQLEAWGLSPAEKDVALLLLKGLSHKEIGEVRHVSEATVRQQARALYKKAGLGGRADLAAFFLEDLLDRSTSAGAPTATQG